MNNLDIDFIKNNAIDIFKNKVKIDECAMMKSKVISVTCEDEDYTIFEMDTPLGILYVNVSNIGIYLAFKTLESAKGYTKIFNLIETEISNEIQNANFDDFVSYKPSYVEFRIENTELFKSNYEAMK